MKMTQSGKYFARYEIGELTVFALRDGYVDMPPSRLRQKGNRPFGKELPDQVSLVDGQLRLSVNAFLVIEQGRHILIDTGAGDAWEPTMGKLLLALAEAKVAREDIGTVAFTHTHVDHVSGLVAPDGSDAFPNLDHLLVPQEEVALFGRHKGLARYSQRCVAFGVGFSVSKCVTTVPARGHEVGHTAFQIASGEDELLIWGDIVHVPSIQFTRPEFTWEYDADQAQALLTRKMFLERAARQGVFVAGAHLDFPGIGSVTRVAEAYRFSTI